ncbi:NADH:ubiquinone reductase (Na(+)-transporting) subunit C [Sodalis-like symbiont of Philaenus spumarius]|nr:NADH:ubiquinone reductase (Na(+)-transporting) subunit C [Sodalis-like symbiont of Philaenus spumarius]
MRKGKIIVASIMLLCVVCFAAGVGYFLLINNHTAEPEDAQRIAAIIQVAGLGRAGEADTRTLNALYHRRVIARQVNLDSGTLLPKASPQNTPHSSMSLSTERDPAQIHQRCTIGDVYFIHKNNEIQQIILPIYGKGAKSMMYAFIALDPDGRTVKNLLYYQQNETPLLGALVTDPDWLRQWTGKKLLNDDAQPALKVVQSGANPQDVYTVYGISGATITSTGVEKSVNFWMGEHGYGPFLERLAREKPLAPVPK